MKYQLEKAIEICGGQTGLANAINATCLLPRDERVQQPHVWNWLNRSGGVVPAEYCRPIEQATDGRVTRYGLRPDVFGPTPACDYTQPQPLKEAA